MRRRGDPISYALQILVLQSWFYICQGLSQLLCKALFAYRHSVQLSDMFQLDTSHRWSTISAHITALPAFIVAVSFVLEHPSHVLDFVCSAYVIHFLVRIVLFGFPSSALWWIFTISEAVVVTIISECAIARRNHIRVVQMSSVVENAGEEEDLPRGKIRVSTSEE